MEFNKSVIEKIEKYCLMKPGVYESRPFGEYPICYRIMGKIFAQLNPIENFYKITLKCEPEKADFYRQIYPGIVVRGYHCPPVQHPYWNTIDLYKFTDMQMLYQMIDEAYDALLAKLSKKDKMRFMKLTKLQFKDTNGTDLDFAMLCARLDETLGNATKDKEERSQYDKYNQRDNIHDVIVAYQDGTPIACGAFKMYDEEHAEIKRIYTEPSMRNMGIGAELVRRLEAKAKIKGYRWCILETGSMLEAAHHMYKKAGYKIIPNYGQYENMPNSICMEKKI